jgi:hypothetical protein
MKMRISKEQLLKENTELKTLNANIKGDDYFRRDQLSELLGRKRNHMIYDISTSRPKPMSWEEIFFTIGELNADASYSCVLAELDKVRIELDKIKNKPIKKEIEL